MGRVKRYKKIKSCDPFCKSKREQIDNVHDFAPGEGRKKKRRRNNFNLDDENDLEKFYQVEALKDLKKSEGSAMVDKIKKIEGKKDDETLKQFKNRLRQETRETLRDNFKKHSSTAIKRKERLKERKIKRKMKGKKDDDSDVEDYSLNSKSSEVMLQDLSVVPDSKLQRAAEAPPDLSLFKLKMKMPEKPQVSDKFSSLLLSRPDFQKQDTGLKKKRKLDEIFSSNVLDEEGAQGLQGNIGSGSGKVIDNGILNPGARRQAANTSALEMEKLRIQAIEAYRNIRSNKMNKQ